jgi:hypothetical protein
MTMTTMAIVQMLIEACPRLESPTPRSPLAHTLSK